MQIRCIQRNWSPLQTLIQTCKLADINLKESDSTTAWPISHLKCFQKDISVNYFRDITESSQVSALLVHAGLTDAEDSPASGAFVQSGVSGSVCVVDVS